MLLEHVLEVRRREQLALRQLGRFQVGVKGGVGRREDGQDRFGVVELGGEVGGLDGGGKGREGGVGLDEGERGGGGRGCFFCFFFVLFWVWLWVSMWVGTPRAGEIAVVAVPFFPRFLFFHAPRRALGAPLSMQLSLRALSWNKSRRLGEEKSGIATRKGSCDTRSAGGH